MVVWKSAIKTFAKALVIGMLILVMFIGFLLTLLTAISLAQSTLSELGFGVGATDEMNEQGPETSATPVSFEVVADNYSGSDAGSYSIQDTTSQGVNPSRVRMAINSTGDIAYLNSITMYPKTIGADTNPVEFNLTINLWNVYANLSIKEIVDSSSWLFDATTFGTPVSTDLWLVQAHDNEVTGNYILEFVTNNSVAWNDPDCQIALTGYSGSSDYCWFFNDDSYDIEVAGSWYTQPGVMKLLIEGAYWELPSTPVGGGDDDDDETSTSSDGRDDRSTFFVDDTLDWVGFVIENIVPFFIEFYPAIAGGALSTAGIMVMIRKGIKSKRVKVDAARKTSYGDVIRAVRDRFTNN